MALSWEGLRVPEIAGELGCHEQTVRRWLHRFNASGLDGLVDLGGQGRKRRSPRPSGPGSSRWSGSRRPGARSPGPTAPFRPPTRSVRRCGRWPRRPGPRGSRSGAVRCAGFCWWRACVGAVSGPGCGAGIPTSREKDADRRALHQPARGRDGPVRRRAWPDDPPYLPAGAGLVTGRAPNQK
ncbi:helix-turn-helix domain-containing protein [Streptomyces sp. GD-15H]|uniref:helix-turn-helix domain-containing protein n=1 Tax=Streptomyces sp. GD-15H TaxID=3129112 RepID=UPI003243C207